MKQSFLIGIITLYCSFSSAQVIKFKAFQDAALLNRTDSAVWEDVDILVVMNVPEKKLKIYSRKTQDIDLISTDKKYDDEEGDHWIEYTGIDGNGKMCGVKFVMYDRTATKHVGSLVIMYGDATLLYRLKKN